ncbi:ABC transporter permease [Clostridium sp. LBM24168]
MRISITVETKTIKKLGICVFWIIIWEILSALVGSDILLPSPFQVLKSLFTLIGDVYFWKSILYSLFRVILGISISIFSGIILGIFAGINKFVEDFLQPIVISIKSTPVMSIIIIALVWFTSSNVVIFTAILICFPIVYTNVLEGIRSADKNLIQMARLYRVKEKYILKDIYLPGIKNYIVSGILMCLGIGWKVSVAAEVLSTPKYSIGINLLDAKTMLETSELFAWTSVVIALSFMFEIIFKYFINRFSSCK